MKDPKEKDRRANQEKLRRRKQAVINKMRNRLKELSPSQDPNQNMETRIDTVASELKKEKRNSLSLFTSQTLSGFLRLVMKAQMLTKMIKKIEWSTTLPRQKMASEWRYRQKSQDAINQKIKTSARRAKLYGNNPKCIKN